MDAQKYEYVDPLEGREVQLVPGHESPVMISFHGEDAEVMHLRMHGNDVLLSPDEWTVLRELGDTWFNSRAPLDEGASESVRSAVAR